MAGTCTRCDGCGQIADTDEGEPWTQWANLPVQSAAAVLMGIVKPIPCPACGGVGVARVPSVPEATHRLWTAIGDRIEEWEAKAKEGEAKVKEGHDPADANFALGVASGLRMAMVMVRRVRDGEEANR